MKWTTETPEALTLGCSLDKFGCLGAFALREPIPAPLHLQFSS